MNETYLASAFTADVNARMTALQVPFAILGVPSNYPTAVLPCVVIDSQYAPSGAVILQEPTTASAVQQAVALIAAAEQAGIASVAAFAATQQSNHAALIQKVQTALGNNASYLANPSVTQGQAIAQVSALTRQTNALVRLAANFIDTLDGT